MSAQVNLNIDELKDFLKHIIGNNKHLQDTGKVPTAVNIEGPAGLGKTSAAIQLTQELDYNLVRVNLAQIEELGDLIGFPVRQFQLCKKTDGKLKTIVAPQLVKTMVKEMVTQNKAVQKQVMGADGKLTMRQVMVPVQVEVEVEKMVAQELPVTVSGENIECMWIDEKAVEEYIKQGYEFTGQKRMAYCPPEWIAGLEDKPGLLILDDYSRADQRFIQACMTLIETQKYISWALPKGWTILLTTNPDNGEYLVTPMDIAQKTRFISVNLKFDVEIWAKWAEKEGIDGRCINFLLLHPEVVTEQCNARAIVTFFNAISSIQDFNTQLPLVQMIGEGSVGPEFATLFTTFINNRLDKLITPKEILLGSDKTKVFTQLKECIGSGNDYRADIASILSMRLINYTVNYSENNTISAAVIQRLTDLATDTTVLTADLQYVLVKKVLNGNKQKFQKLMTNPEVMKMAMK